jgi:dTDP-4-amino-4,6-dideoxygalactose transaminase
VRPAARHPGSRGDGDGVIAKKAEDRVRHTLPFHYFPRGRDAFEYALRLPLARGRKVLLPGYIGWGAVEGSGVYDPVTRARKDHEFYRMKGLLEIDVAGLGRMIERNPGAILLLIHYFGFKDRNLARVKKIARKHDCLVVEDFAHGLFTFFRDPVVDFDFGIFSLHKMLPYRKLTGGMLLSPHDVGRKKEYQEFHHFNLGAIARARRDNYAAALERLAARPVPGVTVLRPVLGESVPESFPILLPDRKRRDGVHREMNGKGFGLISLYHELIAPIDETFRTERRISDRITNLPVHQDADPPRVRRMIDALGNLLTAD